MEEIRALEFEEANIKRDMDSTKSEQVQHYYSLLKNGQDCRKDGLIWVIKALWMLGESIQISNMPQFLDSYTIKFLFEFAKLDIKRKELHEVMVDLKLKQRKQRISSYVKNKTTTMMSEGVKTKQ